MAKRCIIGVMVTNRVTNATQLQKVFTELGCYIKTRLGLHEVNENVCSPNGLIILELYGGSKAFAEVEKRLKEIEGLQVKKMLFSE